MADKYGWNLVRIEETGDSLLEVDCVFDGETSRLSRLSMTRLLCAIAATHRLSRIGKSYLRLAFCKRVNFNLLALRFKALHKPLILKIV